MKLLKKEFKYIIKKYGINSKQAYDMSVILSSKIDRNYNKKTVQSYYSYSIKKLMIYIIKNEKNPNQKIWNRYAVKNRCLSAQTISYIYGQPFNILCRKIRKRINENYKNKNLLSK